MNTPIPTPDWFDDTVLAEEAHDARQGQVRLIVTLLGQARKAREGSYEVKDAVAQAKEIYAACGLEWLGGQD